MSAASGLHEMNINSIGKHVKPYALPVLFHANTQTAADTKLAETYARQNRRGMVNKGPKDCNGLARQFGAKRHVNGHRVQRIRGHRTNDCGAVLFFLKKKVLVQTLTSLCFFY
jgi:hypothetical protein